MNHFFRITLLLLLAAAMALTAAACASGDTSSGAADHTAHAANADANADSGAEQPAADPPAEQASPYTLDAKIEKRDDGYYVLVESNLTFSTENYGRAPVEGEGHVHLYVNGGLVGPIQSKEPKLLTNLKEGENKIRLILAQNNHSIYPGVPPVDLVVDNTP